MKRRSTKQREIVYDALMQLYHPTAEEVYEYLRGAYPTIGRATVFRNLAVLAEEGRIVKLFFPDKEPYENITWTVDANRVRCFRMNNLDDMCGYEVEREAQYAMKLSSDTEIVVQYGRLDNRQTNLAYYTTLGF